MPGESHGQRSLVGYSLWGHKESDTTKRLQSVSQGMMLKLKLQYFDHLMRRVDSLEDSDAERDWGQEEKGMTEDEMAGWYL